MAFEDVDISKLKSNLKSCREKIKLTTLEELYGCLDNNSVWNSESKKNLKKSLNTLIKTRYENLIKKLDSYTTAASYIEKYKELQNDNIVQNQNISTLVAKAKSISGYVVVTGDTIQSICNTHHTSVSNFYTLNNIDEKYTIKVGERVAVLSGAVTGYCTQINNYKSKITANIKSMNEYKSKAESILNE